MTQAEIAISPKRLRVYDPVGVTGGAGPKTMCGCPASTLPVGGCGAQRHLTDCCRISRQGNT